LRLNGIGFSHLQRTKKHLSSNARSARLSQIVLKLELYRAYGFFSEIGQRHFVLIFYETGVAQNRVTNFQPRRDVLQKTFLCVKDDSKN